MLSAFFFVRFYIMFFFFFPGIDVDPVVDPLVDLDLSFRRHCYGANLSSAILFLQQDTLINDRNGDRFQVSGFPVRGRFPSGAAAQKAAGLSLVSELIAGWYTANSRPRVLAVLLPRRLAVPGSITLPPLIFVFVDSRVATEVRIKLYEHVTTSAFSATRKAFIEPVLTKATYVRMEILYSIRRALLPTVDRCSVPRHVHTPLLYLTTVGRDRTYGFTESCELFGHLLTADLLHYAYKLAGRTFHNRLAATFLVLIDGAQPVANFFVPVARVVAPATTTAVQAVSTPEIAILEPVVPNYLQRTLFAPVPSGSGSGRKRPAEASSESAKRAAT